MEINVGDTITTNNPERTFLVVQFDHNLSISEKDYALLDLDNLSVFDIAHDVRSLVDYINENMGGIKEIVRNKENTWE